MNQINEMITDIKNVFEEYLRERRGEHYAFSRLWEEFYDDDPDEEMIVYNLIIANLNLEQKEITENQTRCIERVFRDYMNNKEKIISYYEEDNNIIISLIDNIKKKITNSDNS